MTEWKRADAVTGRRLVLGNGDVRISYVVGRRGLARYYRNAIGDECVYVESGAGDRRDGVRRAAVPQRRLRGLSRARPRTAGCPRARTAARLYAIEANSHIAPPKRYLSRYGQLLEHAPYCERDLHGPTEPFLVDGHRRRGAGQAPRQRPGGVVGTRMTYADAPVRRGRLGRLPLPVHVQRRRLQPITGKVHQPPPVHQVFEGQNFVICNFVPRKVDYHPLAIPVPYYHSNVDSDEVMFYVGGDYEARKGSGIEHGLDLAAPGRLRPRPAARRPSRRRSARSTSTSSRSWSTRSGRSSSARAAAPARTRRTPGPGPAGGRSGDRRARTRCARVTALAIADGSLFGADNLPYGVFSTAGSTAAGRRPGRRRRGRPGRALGTDGPDAAFAAPALNPFMAQGRARWTEVRERITALVTGDVPDAAVHAVDTVVLHLPFEVADYVDFYASEHHATNLGRMFRPGCGAADAELEAPARRLPRPGRHGGRLRHGRRPSRRAAQGPRGRRADLRPEHPARHRGRAGLRRRVGTPLGAPIPVDAFAEHVFGAVLVNDWSARDLQAWEYVPLGPFLGKTFATSVSPWVVPLLALEAARIPLPGQNDPQPLPYLRASAPWGLDVDLAVEWNGEVVSRPPYRQMYWSPAQKLAHLTVNGASPRTGDLFASGTVSGPAKNQHGSFIELTWGGREPITVQGEQRTFLLDGDDVVLTGTAPGAAGGRIGFGEVRGRIVPAP